ncbi:aldehyde dehydrogenase (NADP(+)) [Leifsonia aquatica]|uniref:aldehyde dehydrogenase (NADP(+)) n=1 Tax=Leifsonia aquatica TaxID=144185 RepID=UPI0037F37836
MTHRDPVAAAADAAAPAASASRARRAAWLDALATMLERNREELVAIAAEETHLTAARLDGEVTRTAAQLRFFAEVVLDGSYLEATIDTADDTRTPPRPDLRRILRPIGPVGVFAASNFPFAFSVLGNDTASALAAGCPVVVKAHPGHPRLSRRVAELSRLGLVEAGAPEGLLGMVQGMEEGVALVRHPAIRAIGFTGSTTGGRALFDLASARPAPIPFYGELGSINPVVVTEDAARARAESIATGLVGSFTRDGGQYCTKPGLVFIPDTDAGELLLSALSDHLALAPSQALLTEQMTTAFDDHLDAADLGEDDVLRGYATDEGTAPIIITIDMEQFLSRPEYFAEECFGPLTVVVRYHDRLDLPHALESIEGSLTATLHMEPSDDVTALVDQLTARVGRVIFNGWPTGVAIAWSQHHGGPWPATTASVHTSVGASAIRRFLTPTVYQDCPPRLLPPELSDDSDIPRRIDGILVLP